MAAGEGKRRWLVRAGLVLWVVVVSLVSSALLAGHVLALPAPAAADARLAQGLGRWQAGQARWQALHVLADGCRCSGRLVQHLLDRGPSATVPEAVVLVRQGPDEPPRVGELRAAGYGVEVLSAAEAEERYGVVAVPLLVVADPTGAVRYAGGYTDRKASPVIRDREVMAELLAGKAPATLPTFGCAVSARLKRAVDPLSLR